MSLSTKDKKTLKRIAHDMKPVVYIGQKGITESLIAAAQKALTDHELVKMKFVDYKESKKAMSEEIVKLTEAELVALIGNTVIVYKKQDDPEKRIIKL